MSACYSATVAYGTCFFAALLIYSCASSAIVALPLLLPCCCRAFNLHHLLSSCSCRRAVDLRHLISPCF